MGAAQITVAGGGAAGFFAAIACAEAAPGARVTILEKSGRFLDKVRISGGGRCNVTHACFEPGDLAARYPRGGPALRGSFGSFSPRDTVEWFEARGVELKTEADGRMFPVTDSSQTIVDCLLEAARAAGVELCLHSALESVRKLPHDRFELELSDGRATVCERLLLATGGCRAAAAGRHAVALGHTLEPPVPSLFAFRVESPWLTSLAGISLEQAEVSIPVARLRERGPLLITHWGLSGPAVLRLSAWGARSLHALDYHFPLAVNWVPELSAEELGADLNNRRRSLAAKRVANAPVTPLPARLWEQLVLGAGIPEETRWASLTRAQAHELIRRLTRSELAVTGRSLNRDEFVTCGGVRLREVDFKTMESRICPGLHFAGELLDVDGLTGGFNFQAAWTTGWLAGRAMAAHC